MCRVLSKKKSRYEVLNDLDEELVNFLMTVKLHPRELARTLKLIPNSRALFAKFMDSVMEFSSVIRAARFFWINKASFGGLSEHWAPHGHAAGLDFKRFPMRIYRAALRLADATLECAPWQEVVEKHDGPQTLFYFDPPYLGTGEYAIPFHENDWRELRKTCGRLKGKFVLSASGTAKMKLLFRGFHERLTEITSSLGSKDRIQKELLVWNY